MYVDDAPYIKNAMLTGECGMYSTPRSGECLEDFRGEDEHEVEADCMECKRCEATDSGCVCHEGHMLITNSRWIANNKYYWCNGKFFEEEDLCLKKECVFTQKEQ